MLPRRSTLISFGLAISEARASASASSVDVGMGIWIGTVEVGVGVVEGTRGWVLRKYMGSSWW